MATIINGNSYRFKAWNDNLYLNIYTRGNLANGQNVCTYALTGTDMAQVWDVTNYSGYGVSGQLMKSRKNNAYALDHWRGSTNTHNADIYAVGTSAGDLRDQLVEFVVISNGCYRIKLKYPTSEGSYLYLTVNTSTTPHNVYWTTLTGNTDQLWYRELYRGSNPPRVSSSIRNTTWMVKNLESGKYLNVYGNDTVVNSRNVTVYDLENCQAQRWVIKNTANGPKLFTKINEAFALNIYNSNCNMYTASGNDDDSLLQFEQVSGNVYRIRMYRHGLYLNEDGTASGSNVSWTSSVGSSSLWQLVSEADAFPSAGQAPVSLTDTVFYVRNYQTGYMLNVYGNETVANGRNVNTYSRADVDAEKWKVINTANGPKIYSELGKSNGRNVYAINYYNDNCVMYSSQGTNNDYDSLLVLEPYDALERIYRIKLFNYDGYLYAESIGSGADVRWSSNVNLYTLWQFITPEELSQETPDPLHSEIKDHTFCIRPYGKQVYLNVHGNDTVTNGRNVNLFSLTDCLAQKWEPRDTANGPKLFTEIDSRFALNIYGSGNTNCTMYTAEGNDSDSILEFIRVSRYRYLIKMYHHDLYLTYSGEGVTGDNVYWDVLSESKVWEFVPVDDVEFPQGTTIPRNADSALVTSFIPALTTNYTQDRASEGGVISEICIHHMAGNMSIEALGALWQTEGRNGSSHYGVNGRNVGQYVKERDIAWTNGDWTSNKRSVTIEVANISTTDPNWTVSDETLDTLVKLIADIARRNGLGLLTKGVNLTWHSMYSATACPGPYLTSKLDEIVERANNLITMEGQRIYLRKFNTGKFLGVDRNDRIILVGRSHAYPFIRKDDVIKDFTNQSRILRVNDANGLPYLSSSSTGYTDVGIDQDNEGFVTLYTENTRPNRSGGSGESVEHKDDGQNSKIIGNRDVTVRSILTDISGNIEMSTDEENKWEITVDPTTAAFAEARPSVTAGVLLGKRFLIKHKATGLYLTASEESHPGGEGCRVRLTSKNESARQVWKFKSYITPYDSGVKSLVPYLSTIHPVEITDVGDYCVVDNKDETDPVRIGVSTETVNVSGNEYRIKLTAYDKYLGGISVYRNDYLVRWTSVNDDVWVFEEQEYVLHNNWLKLFMNPINNSPDRVVEMPSVSSFYGPDGFQYSFQDRHEWFGWENPYITVNPNVYDVYTPVVNTIVPGAYTNENGYYWVAVGPLTAYETFQYGVTYHTYSIFYGNGLFDAVVKDAQENQYYIHCVVGDIKGHCFSNGIVQTWYAYSENNPNGEFWWDHSRTDDYDGLACIEFIGPLSGKTSGMNKYAIDVIRCYEN